MLEKLTTVFRTMLTGVPSPGFSEIIYQINGAATMKELDVRAVSLVSHVEELQTMSQQHIPTDKLKTVPVPESDDPLTDFQNELQGARENLRQRDSYKSSYSRVLDVGKRIVQLEWVNEWVNRAVQKYIVRSIPAMKQQLLALETQVQDLSTRLRALEIGNSIIPDGIESYHRALQKEISAFWEHRVRPKPTLLYFGTPLIVAFQAYQSVWEKRLSPFTPPSLFPGWGERVKDPIHHVMDWERARGIQPDIWGLWDPRNTLTSCAQYFTWHARLFWKLCTTPNPILDANGQPMDDYLLMRGWCSDSCLWVYALCTVCEE